MKYPGYTEIKFQNADELWESLSPTKELVKKPYNFIYRGQGDASWQLIPSILRKNDLNPVKILWGDYKADEQVFAEISLLRMFANYCDSIGVMTTRIAGGLRKAPKKGARVYWSKSSSSCLRSSSS